MRRILADGFTFRLTRSGLYAPNLGGTVAVVDVFITSLHQMEPTDF